MGGVALIKRTELSCVQWRCVAPLIMASKAGRSTAVHTLIGERSNPDAKDPEGQPALQHAAAKGHLDVVKVLLAARALPDAKAGKDMRTALHRASSHGHLVIAQELLAAGADPRSKDAWGRTAQELAEMQEHAAVASAVAPKTLRGSRVASS